jgi:hypothetical protein
VVKCCNSEDAHAIIAVVGRSMAPSVGSPLSETADSSTHGAEPIASEGYRTKPVNATLRLKARNQKKTARGQFQKPEPFLNETRPTLGSKEIDPSFGVRIGGSD